MILPQLDNKILSTFLLTIDNKILSKGQAFINYSSYFYPVANSYFYGKYAYTCPFKSLCNDTSISGANVLSGVYLNGNYVSIGQSGLSAINHYQGAIYFNNPLPINTIISGNYAIKDFTIEITDEPEYKLLFETKYTPSFKYNQTVSGLDLDVKTFPIIFLRTKNDDDEPFALGGIENKKKIIRAVVVADTEYQRMAVCNILKDMMYSPLFLIHSVPFDTMGNITGINYNFTNLVRDTAYYPWIMKVKTSDVQSNNEFKDLRQNISFVDFYLNTITMHSY